MNLIDKIVKEARWINSSVDTFDVEGDDYGAVCYDRPPNNDVYLYTPIENIGKRGKTVTQYHLSLWVPREGSNRTAWAATAEDKLKSIKKFDDAIKYVRELFEKGKSEMSDAQFNENKPWVLKGVDHKLPLPARLNIFKDKKGDDVNVYFKKPTITIGSKSEQEKFYSSHQNTWIEIPWKFAIKVNTISDELIKLKGFDQVGKMLRDNGIEFRERIEMDAMYQ